MKKVECFVIGVQKGGTTSLYNLLKRFSNIVVSSKKETKFFFNDYLYEKGESYYQSCFDSRGEGIFVDVDPEYSLGVTAIERILKYNKDARFVFLLREPVSRAYSHYLMSVRRGIEERSFEEAFFSSIHDSPLNNIDVDKGYFQRGKYELFLRELYARVDSKNVCLSVYEEFVASEDERRRVLKFIGVSDGEIHKADDLPRANVAKASKIRILSYILHHHNWIKNEKARRLISYLKMRLPYVGQVYGKLRDFNMTEADKKELSADLRKEMSAYYVSDVDYLVELGCFGVKRFWGA